MSTITRRKTRAALLSVGANLALLTGKLTVGLAIGSVAVISDALHSATDLLASIIALVAVRRGSQPADEEHPFGHGKIENLAGTVEALLIFLAAGWITYEAIHKLLRREPVESPGWGVLAMLGAALITWLVSAHLFRVGRQTESVALLADAWHLRTDVWTSLGVSGGLALIWLGGRVLPGVNLYWLDPVAALAVAALILGAAWRLTMHAGRDLLDVRLPAVEEKWLRDYLTRATEGHGAFHRLRTRRGGSTRYVTFHLLVPPQMPVAQAHELSDQLVAGIREHFPGALVLVHVEPQEAEGEG